MNSKKLNEKLQWEDRKNYRELKKTSEEVLRGVPNK